MIRISFYCSLVLVLLLCCNTSYGQLSIPEDQIIKSGTSGQENYLMFTSTSIFPKDSADHVSTAGFIVERARYEGNPNTELSYRKVADVKPVSSRKELRALFNQKEVSDMLLRYRLGNEEELLGLFSTKASIPKIRGDYMLDVRYQIAMGDAWVDKKVEKGSTYIYKINRVNQDGSASLLGYAVQTVRDSNKGLLLFSVDSNRVDIYNSDTLMNLTWFYSINSGSKAPITDRIPALGSGDENYALENKMDKFLRFRIYVMKNGILLPGIFKSGGYANATSITVSTLFNVRPDDEIIAWIAPEDMFGNQGNPSDTVFAYSLSYSKAPLLNDLYSENVEDGLRLSWPTVPDKPYIKGIKIQRYNTNNVLEDLALLPVSDTVYTDYDMQIGNVYRYEARVVFSDAVGFQQTIPAQISGAVKLFSKPMPPTNLQAINRDRHIQLNWDGTHVKGLYGYHVYRGYDGTEPTLLAGPITDATTYTDTSAELSGKSVYTYQVVSENLRQELSLPSEQVHIRPDRSVKLYAPATVQTYYANGKVNISWDDARKADNYITGYQVQRRIAPDGAYQNLGSVVLYNQTIDSNITPGVVYHYRVASVGSNNEVSKYSEGTQFELRVDKDFSKVTIAARNTHEGVALSWSGVERPGQQAYIIYRRKPSEKSFTILATVENGTTSFTDKTVTAGDNYIYAIALKFKDNEGPKSDAKSITHQPAAKPEILK